MSNEIIIPKLHMGGGTNTLSAEPLALTEVSNPYSVKIAKNLTVEASSINNKPLVDLSYYASNNISNYRTITELPQEHIDYLNSVRGTKMSWMFSQCMALTSLDASNFDTSNVTDMDYVFYNCKSLTSLDVSKWDTSKVTNMTSMFDGCQSLTSLDVSKWDTSKVTNTYRMLTSCNSLTSLDISNFDTSKVTDMSWMFAYCNSLTTITGAIDMSSCTDCRYMFDDCPKLKGVHLKNVPRSLDISKIGGTKGVTYIIDNYI